MVKINYDEEAARLVSLLGRGKKNAVRRSALREQFGGTDRHMRKVIAYARLLGHRINNDQDGCGYYLPDELEELDRQYKQMKHRAKTILAQMTAIRYEMERYGIPGQMRIKASDIEVEQHIAHECEEI